MDEPTPVTPPAWYDDGHGQLRWWDGDRWTEHTAPLTGAVPTPQPVPRPASPARDLVAVKRSNLVWILPLVMVLAAVLGGALAVPLAKTVSDTDPLRQTYAQFLRAERDRDCAALEAVTSPAFREDLLANFSCAAWEATPPVARRSEINWAVRIGPVGAIVVTETSPGTDSIDRTVTTYVMTKQDGRWRLGDQDSESP